MKNQYRPSNTRNGEHAFTDIGQMVLLIVFLAVWITDSFIFRYSMKAGEAVPLYVRLPLAVLLFAGSVALVRPSFKAVFGTPGEPSSIVTKGVYRIVRHPMYFGAWLFVLGIWVTTLSIASLGVVAVLYLFYLYVARHEEVYLEQKYPGEYAEYASKVPMLFPLPKRRN